MAITNPTASLLLDKRRKLKSNKYPVKLVVYYLGSKKRYKLPFSFSEDEWKKIWNKNLRDQNLKDYRVKLNYYKEEKFLSTIKQLSDTFSFKEFERLYFLKSNQLKTVQSENVYNLFDSMIAEMLRNGYVGNGQIYKTSRNCLCLFRPKLRFSDIDYVFLKSFEKHMLSIGRSQSYISIILRNLKTVYLQAIRLGVIDRSNYPFSRERNEPDKYKIKKAKNYKRALSAEQLKKILSPKERSNAEQKALDFWLFSFYGNGINVKDICTLKYGNIKGEHIELYRAKAQDRQQESVIVRFQMNSHIKSVIDKYGVRSKNADNYIFPVLGKNDTPDSIRKKVQNFTRTINTHMKKIGKDLGFDFSITTQYARHSFSYYIYKKGVSIDEVGEALGHSSTKTTKIYLDYIGDDLSKKISGILEEI